MKLFVLIIFLMTSVNAASFSKSKKILLKKVYFDNKTSFYCSNPYEIKQINGKEKTLIVQDSKYYSPRNEYYKSGKVNTRAQRIEWEHVTSVPFIFSKYGQEKSPNLYVLYS